MVCMLCMLLLSHQTIKWVTPCHFCNFKQQQMLAIWHFLINNLNGL